VGNGLDTMGEKLPIYCSFIASPFDFLRKWCGPSLFSCIFLSLSIRNKGKFFLFLSGE
jgi:hypothetical protein